MSKKVWILSLNITFMHSFVVSDWLEAMFKHPELVRCPLFLKDLRVGWGAHSQFRKVFSLPCLPMSALSSVHVCSPTISSGHENSLVWFSLGMWVEGSQGYLPSSVLSVDLSLPGSPYYLSGVVADWLLGPTKMTSSALPVVMLSPWAPEQLSLSGHEAVPTCGPERAHALTTAEGQQWPQTGEP